MTGMPWTIMLRDIDVDETTVGEISHDIKHWLQMRGIEAGVVTVDSAYLRRALKPPGTIIGKSPRAGKDSGRL